MFRLALVGFLVVGVGCVAETRSAPVVPVSAIVTAPPVVSATSSVIVIAPRPDPGPEPAATPIGVVECDRYIALVDACPADASARQGGTRRLLETDGPSWREMAKSSTEGRLAVTFACQAALDGLRQQPCR